MNCSYYSNKVLFAEDLTSYLLNKHLWNNTPFGLKIVAPRTGKNRMLLHAAFNSNVKAAVDILHVRLLNDIKQTFGNIVMSANVNISTFTILAISLRKDYFIYGVDAGSFLNYSVIVAILSGFFYAWGCKDAPEHAVELVAALFPDHEMFYPFCIRLNEVCFCFLQSEFPLLAHILRDSNFTRVPNNGGFKCGCFEYEETGKSFRIVFKERKLALNRHALFCVVNTSYNFVTYRPFDPREIKERYMYSWSLTSGDNMHSWRLKSGDILRNVGIPSKHRRDNVKPSRSPSNEEIYFLKEQMYFGFPNRPFSYRTKIAKTPYPASEDVLSENNEPSYFVEQEWAFRNTTESNVHPNDCSCGMEQIEAIEPLHKEIATELETFQKQDTAVRIDSYLECSSSESSKLIYDANQNKPVAGQIVSIRNEEIIGCLNDEQVGGKNHFTAVLQNSTESSYPLVLTFYPKLMLENTNYIQLSFNKEFARMHLKLSVNRERSRTMSNFKKSLPSPHISEESDESEDCKSLSNKLPDLIPPPDTIEISTPFTNEISGVKGDSLKLLNQSFSEKWKSVANTAGNTMLDLMIPQVKVLFQHYQRSGLPDISFRDILYAFNKRVSEKNKISLKDT